MFSNAVANLNASTTSNTDTHVILPKPVDYNTRKIIPEPVEYNKRKSIVDTMDYSTSADDTSAFINFNA